VTAFLGLAAPAAAQTEPAGFADWTKGSATAVEGTLLGRSIAFTAVEAGPNSVLDGTSTKFASPLFAPQLALSDAPELLLRDAGTFTLSFGAPVVDPVIHVSDLRSSLHFPVGTRIVKRGGSPALTVDRHEVSFLGIDPVDGSFQLLGTFSSLPIQTIFTAGFVDPTFFQVGATLAPEPQPTPVPTPPSTPVPVATPVAGVSLLSQTTSGQVLIRPPGQRTFVPLTPGATVPVGTLVDTSRGRVMLQSLVAGAVQSMTVAGGLFVVRQAGGGPPELRVTTPPGQQRACASRRRGVVRKLTVTVSKGIVRTAPAKGLVTGRDASWTTSDRCDGTLTKVTQGRVTVRNGRRTVTVRAGRSYLIKARLFAARRGT
jgi:hypothetical protein